MLNTDSQGNERRSSPSRKAARKDLHKRRQAKRFLAGATSATLAVSGGMLLATPAQADPGYAQSSAQYLSGSLLGADLAEVVNIAGADAQARFGDDSSVVEANNLDLSVLDGTVVLEAADGVQIPLDLADAGVVGQYASASPQGSSFSATGLVGNDGVVGVGPDETNPPGPLSLDLTDLLGADFTDSITGLTVEVGASTATAGQAAPAAPTGDYNIADATITMNSEALADLSTVVSDATTPLQATVDGVVGPDGSLVNGLVGLLGTAGVATTSTATLDVDLQGVVDGVLAENQVLGGEGPVTVDLSSGLITVDIAALLAANGQDLNDLPEGSELLSPEVLTLITNEVDELVNAVLADVNTAVTEALEEAVLDVNVVISDPADPENVLLAVTINGTLADIADGTTLAVVTVGDVDLITVSLDGVAEDLLDVQLPVDTILAETVDTLAPVLTALSENVLSVTVNDQETVDGVFTQTAFNVALLGLLDGTGEALELNVAQASVGPNALGPDAANPDTIITGFTPVSGPEIGGTAVTITGTGFTDAEDVLFGDVPSPNVVIVSDTEIIATSPAGTGTVALTVTGTPYGDDVSDELFEYIPEEVADVVNFTPISGPEAGGTSVIITGTGFTGVDDVLFGDVPAADFIFVSDTEIVATSPAGTGSVPITIVGTEEGDLVSEGNFTYIAEDEVGVVSFTPVSGPEAGGTVVTIIGGGFTGAEDVVFGDESATDFEVVSDTEIRATSPAGTGSVPITIVGTAGNGDLTSTGSFTYVAAPVTSTVIDDIDPNNGPSTGGTVVTIIGSGLTGADGVNFGETPGTDFQVVSDTEIVVTSPAGTGSVVVTVVGTDNGDVAAEEPFTYTEIGGGDGDGNGDGDGDGGVVTPPGGNGDGVDGDGTGNGNGTGNNGNNNGGVTGGTGGVVYENCAAAEAAGVTPLGVDDPGYSKNLDRDGDGVACEDSTNDAVAQTGGENPLPLWMGIGGVLLVGAGVFFATRKTAQQ